MGQCLGHVGGLGSIKNISYPKGPKYPNMEYIHGFCISSCNYGLGYRLHIWVLGPVGFRLLEETRAGTHLE